MKEYVSWEQVENFVQRLVEVLKQRKQEVKGIYGIPRGGLTLATMLSYRLDVPLVLAPTAGCIIVDDIADSGKTLMHYTTNDTQFNEYFIATMYYAERSKVKPDFYQYIKGDKWIVFPWEEDTRNKV